jgi:glycosyltransferase involved in cell wall biosynthesis
MVMNKTREQNARVTIVILAHNEERRLKACLQAVAAQTVTPHQVIVVDNNSTDGTAAIARSFPFVTLVNEKQQGIVYARNTGFDAATGDIIGRIDADSIMPGHWVSHVQAYYAEPDRLSQAWTGSGIFYNVRLPRLMSWAYSLLAFRLNNLMTGYSTLWGSNMAITRQQWLAVRAVVHIRTDIHEDLDLALHIADAGYGITYDTQLKTQAELRRVLNDRHKLWDYTMWWPNTLRVHNKKSWILCWWISVTIVYPGVYCLAFLDTLARLMGRRLSA